MIEFDPNNEWREEWLEKAAEVQEIKFEYQNQITRLLNEFYEKTNLKIEGIKVTRHTLYDKKGKPKTKKGVVQVVYSVWIDTEIKV